MDHERAERWKTLLSDERLGDSNVNPTRLPGRSEFDRDYDRIMFSNAFRRMHDKTQVFPLSPSDHTRTRLTHSLEVSCVGRSLGQMAGKSLDVDHLLPDSLCYGDVGTIVSAACLAHDIGNPPFGHSGESAIQQWARAQFADATSVVSKAIHDTPPVLRKDFEDFEGNAQGFRIFAKLQGRERKGGLRLTLATVGAMMKYPHSSDISNIDAETSKHDVSRKKFGFFHDDADLACEALDKLKVKKTANEVYSRHPLALLMEAADDICYAIIDLEDACLLKVISYQSVEELLMPIANKNNDFKVPDYEDEQTKLAVLRANSINVLTMACEKVYKNNLIDIEAGNFAYSLISQTGELHDIHEELKNHARKKVYTNERVLQVEYAGYQAIGGLLDIYSAAIVPDHADAKGEKIRELFPKHYFLLGKEMTGSPDALINQLSSYQRLLVVTDYISGMTDRFAVELFQRLSGIKLPS